MCISHFVYSSVKGQSLGCFCLLPIMNGAAVNIGVCVCLSLWFQFVWGMYPGVELLDRLMSLAVAF